MNTLCEKVTWMLILLLGFYSFFSAVDFSSPIAFALCLLLEGILWVSKGTLRINTVYALWCVDIMMMFLHAEKISMALLVYNTLLLVLILMCIVMTMYGRSSDLARFVRILVGFAVISIAVVVAEAVLKNLMLSVLSFILPADHIADEKKSIRAGTGYTGLAEFPNVISMAGGLLVCYAVYYLKKTERRKQILLIGIGIVGILLSAERSNLAIVPFALLFTYYVDGNKDKLIRGLKIMAAGICCIALLFAMRPFLEQFSAFERVFESISSASQGEDVSNGRSNLYLTALRLWLQHPILGNGWFYFFHNNQGILNTDAYVHTHNLFLELLCDSGIVGAALVMTPIIMAIVQNIRALKNVSPRKNLYRFTLTMQVFFITDSMLHVTFYSVNLISIYFIILMLFYSATEQEGRFSLKELLQQIFGEERLKLNLR